MTIEKVPDYNSQHYNTEWLEGVKKRNKLNSHANCDVLLNLAARVNESIEQTGRLRNHYAKTYHQVFSLRELVKKDLEKKYPNLFKPGEIDKLVEKVVLKKLQEIEVKKFQENKESIASLQKEVATLKLKIQQAKL